MRAPPGRACAPRVIARKSRRVGITFALVMTSKPELGRALVTLQNREFTHFTDTDIER